MFKVNNSLLVSQNPDVTEITLITDNGMNIIRPRVQGNHINKSDDELIELGLREFYKQYFADKFQNESIESLNEKVKEIDSIYEEVSQVRDEIKSVHNEVTNLSKVVFAKDLTAEEKEELISQYPVYEAGASYRAGDVINYNGELYRVIQEHTSQNDWKPDSTPSLYTPYLKGEIADKEIVHEWRQPLGAHDAYQTGDKVLFEGKVYESTMDGNTWSPEDYPQGWELVEQE